MSKTLRKGVLKTWKDDRGFGFIQPDNGDTDVFIHISAFNSMTRRPLRGDVIWYEAGADTSGKFKAVNARIEGLEPVLQAPKPARKWLWLLAIALGLVSAAVAAFAFLF
ncbi:MAG: DNA-binding protein [Methylomonas sp.]|nr:MAG: DNA-binding protein [Methylomonas sp.]PPD24700.1 MAG: DNA-binding protein [Methylomonas sp.]PPD33233.1 MAG: DNA-binding protein [Methylomonas sp.]PPD41180.1 MAG: DNA-binding protein [Methylomonas sp.]PPD54755.1 MAG: DNA-binding protein [Methylomonas sp.]